MGNGEGCRALLEPISPSRHSLTGDTSYKGDERGCWALLEPGRPSGYGLLGYTSHTGNRNGCRAQETLETWSDGIDTSHMGNGRGCKACQSLVGLQGVVCWEIPAIRAMKMGVEPC